jgi:hypothetical protein
MYLFVVQYIMPRPKLNRDALEAALLELRVDEEKLKIELNKKRALIYVAVRALKKIRYFNCCL